MPLKKKDTPATPEPPKKKGTKAVPDRSLASCMRGDALCTGIFVLASSIIEELAVFLAPQLGISELYVAITILVAMLMAYGTVLDIIGGKGTSFNPASNLAMAAAGKLPLRDSIFRSVASVAGAVVGGYAAMTVIPSKWQSRFPNLGIGLRPEASLSSGWACEFALTFILHIIVLWSMEPQREGTPTALLATNAITPVNVLLGMTVSGPSLNPAVSFGWYLQYPKADTPLEHFVTFWAGPICGAIAAGGLWWALFVKKQKKKGRSKKTSPTSPAVGTPAHEGMVTRSRAASLSPEPVERRSKKLIEDAKKAS